MISDWFSRVGSSIPRGFSRHYILELLSEQPMTGKEIIDKAIVQTGGKWKPSPGLIYPLLGRLLGEGLIEEHENGRYIVTKKGISIASDIKSAHNIIQKHLEVVFRIGNMGRFMTMDLLDKIFAIGSTLSSNLDRMTEEEKNKYKEFLVNELNKISKQDKIQIQDKKIDENNIL
ncbi:MAG: PadR family transcriptional regulator [Nitrosopumilus sp.]|nr:PadR family transcriptional regulator [Nitrosopumilus sp.]